MKKIATLIGTALALSACCFADSHSPQASPQADHGEETHEAPKPKSAPGASSEAPEIPDGRSKPPTLAEWGEADQVNTVGANSAPRNCYMKVVREWLKVHCEGQIREITNEEGLGGEGVEHFRYVNDKVADIIVRVRKGQHIKLRIMREGQSASLFVNWPGGQSKPSIMALQIFNG